MATAARENILMVATGRKRIGKSYTTFKHLLRYIKLHNRKVLIFDVNNEYGSFEAKDDEARDLIGGNFYYVKTIDIKDVPAYTLNPKSEIRRISPILTEDVYDGAKLIQRGGQIMSDSVRMRALEIVLTNFRGGLLLIEDLTSIFGDSIPREIQSMITRNAHVDLDIIMHLQSISPILPRFWQNTNITRFHKQIDGVDKSKHKLEEKYEMYKIAEIIVEYQYNDLKNERYFLYINNSDCKISGNVTKQIFIWACNRYVKQHPSCTRHYQLERDDNGKKVYTYNQAIERKTLELFKTYYGN